MDYKKTGQLLYIRVDKGENVVETIIAVCIKENVCGGHFQGIGACQTATLSTYIASQNNFISHTISGMLEMISLIGNVTIDNKHQPFVHCHAVFSYLNDNGKIEVTAGHLEDAKISYTGEVVLNICENKIGRKFDANAGIDVWAL